MMIVSEEHYFEYRQVCVYLAEMSNPYNHWTKEEWAQGFAYRPESVSFITTWAANDYRVSIEMDDAAIDPSAIIVIQVPFVSPANRKICISSVMDSAGDEIAVSLPPGMYALRYEAFPPIGDNELDEVQKMRLVFNRDPHPDFAILRAQDIITVPPKLVTQGRAA